MAVARNVELQFMNTPGSIAIVAMKSVGGVGITMISAKKKGNSFEYEIRDTLKHLDPKARRSLMSGAAKDFLQSEEADIATSLPIAIECKRTEKIKLYEFWEQAVTANRNIDKIPILAVRSNNKPALAVMDWSDFVHFLKFSLVSGVTPKTITKESQAKKKIKLTVEETKDLPFSKFKQVQRGTKRKE